MFSSSLHVPTPPTDISRCSSELDLENISGNQTFSNILNGSRIVIPISNIGVG